MQASETDAWSLEQELSDWKRDAVPIAEDTNHVRHSVTGVENFQRITNPGPIYGLYSDRATKLVNRNPSSVSTAKQSASEENAIHLPSSVYQRMFGVSGNHVHKKRRISREEVADDCPFVFDDASLQRHIAAESRHDLPQSPSVHRSLGSSYRSFSQNAQGDKKLDPPKDRHHSVKMRITPKQRTSRLEPDCSEEGLNEVKTRPCFQRSLVSPHKAHNPSIIVPSDRSTSYSIRKASPPPFLGVGGHRGKGTSPLGDDSSPPVTPSKTSKPSPETTTPRQRELWSRLLIDDGPCVSPFDSDSPGRKLLEEKYKGPKGNKNSTTGEDFTEPQRKRIVDTMHVHDQNVISEDTIDSEDTASTCTGGSSESAAVEALPVDSANTVRTLPCSNSQSEPRVPGNRDLHSASQRTSSPHAAGLKVTYAHQRSYLTTNDLEDVGMFSFPLTVEPVCTDGLGRQVTGARPPKVQAMDIFESQGSDSQESQSGAMRSIHELRKAGGNVRLLSELEAILDDVDEEQPSFSITRQIRLLDLVSKLSESSNCRLLIDQGLESRLLAHAGIHTDIITNSLLAIAILQIIAGPTSRSLLSQIRRVRVMDFLVDLLGLYDSLTFPAKSWGNSSKHTRQQYSDMCKSISKSGIWRAGRPSTLSCHLLALQCLEHLVQQTRKLDSLSGLFSAYVIKRIVVTSIPPSSTQITSVSAYHLELAVSILESCTTDKMSEYQDPLWEGETLERIVGLLPLLRSWKEDEWGTSQSLTLRLYVNLTNNHPSLCEKFSTPEFVGVMCSIVPAHFEKLSSDTTRRQRPLLLDTLILSLGVLVNLAESSDVARQMIMDLSYEEKNYLAILLELFKAKSKSAAEVRPISAQVNHGTDLPRSILKKGLI